MASKIGTRIFGNFFQPFEEEAEVVADGTHENIDVVSEVSFEEVSIQVAIGFAMSDDSFYCGSSPQLLFNLAVDAALLA